MRLKPFKNIAEEKFNQYFSQYKKLTLTKRGMPDFMLIDENGDCFGFVEVKKHKNQKLKKDQMIFKRFCDKHNIFHFVWYPK